MRIARLFALMLAGVVLLGSSALAEDGGGRRRGEQGRDGSKNMRHRRPSPRDRIKRLAERLDLTPDQQAQIKDIYREHRRAAEELRKQTHNKIKAVLTDEQKEKFKKSRSRRGRFPVARVKRFLSALRRLDLSDEQKAKIKKIIARTKKACADVETPKEKAALWRKAIHHIKTKVLTEEQAKKLERFIQRRRGPGQDRPRRGRMKMGPRDDDDWGERRGRNRRDGPGPNRRSEEDTEW